jgi:hypothetical protein
VRRADNLTTLMCPLSRNPGALTSLTPQGHVGLFWGYFTFYLLNIRFQVGRSVIFDIGGHTYLPLYIRFYIPLLVMKIIPVPRSIEKLDYSYTNRIMTYLKSVCHIV